ncbi:MAG: hypothetical protein AB2A00_28100 [Myxococcota bacterium]
MLEPGLAVLLCLVITGLLLWALRLGRDGEPAPWLPPPEEDADLERETREAVEPPLAPPGLPPLDARIPPRHKPNAPPSPQT